MADSFPVIRIELLNPDHNALDFSCGDVSMDNWLQSRALKNQKLAATRTFVAIRKDTEAVIGYYGLSMSQIIRVDAPKSVQRNMPEMTPVVLLGRLAIHTEFQGKGLGRYLIRHVVTMALAAAETVAARMIVTHPIDEHARHFYQRVGFEALHTQPDILAIDLRKARKLVG